MQISDGNDKCGVPDASRTFVMEVVNEQDGLEGASVRMPYVSGAEGERSQEVVDASGAAELVSP